MLEFLSIESNSSKSCCATKENVQVERFANNVAFTVRSAFWCPPVGTRLVYRAASYGAGRGAPGVEPGPPIALLPFGPRFGEGAVGALLLWRSAP